MIAFANGNALSYITMLGFIGAQAVKPVLSKLFSVAQCLSVIAVTLL